MKKYLWNFCHGNVLCVPRCQRDYKIRSFLSIRHAHGDLCKHLGIDSSTDHPDRFSNLFLNAYINIYLVIHYSNDRLNESNIPLSG